jgi:hypothetical protein
MRPLTEDQLRYLDHFKEYGTVTVPMLMILEYNMLPAFGDASVPEQGMYDGSPETRRRKAAIYSRLKTLILRGLVRQVEREAHTGSAHEGYMVRYISYELCVVQPEIPGIVP